MKMYCQQPDHDHQQRYGDESRRITAAGFVQQYKDTAADQRSRGIEVTDQYCRYLPGHDVPQDTAADRSNTADRDHSEQIKSAADGNKCSRDREGDRD